MKKVLLSCLLSFLVLNVVSFLYYKVPVHVTNEDGSTDYVWESNSLYIRTDEGIGFGKTNNEGYMNLNDYDGNIDILIMGSSHMEAQNIPLGLNAASLLNKLLPNMETYNIGVAGHSFKVMVSNLDAALKKYKPKYVVLEVSNLQLSDNYIEKILNNNVEEIESNSEGIIGFLQKFPFLRLGYTQIQKLSTGQELEIDESNLENSSFIINEDLNNKLLIKIKETADKYNTKIVIMFHPSVAISKEGEMIINTKDISSKYNLLCKKNGIYFLDMSDRFVLEYENGYVVPNGFINGAIATGHLNIDGHRMIADELASLIKEIEN